MQSIEITRRNYDEEFDISIGGDEDVTAGDVLEMLTVLICYVAQEAGVAPEQVAGDAVRLIQDPDVHICWVPQ